MIVYDPAIYFDSEATFRPSAVLGIGGVLGHDANAALILDGRLIAAAQEERFTRVKYDGSFPNNAIAECLTLGRISPPDITDVVFAEKLLHSRLFDLSGRPEAF